MDDAIWPWRGDRWAHLVSDTSIEELHEFSRLLGVRRLAFAGDHYDVSASDRERALQLGAEAVNSREIVRRLRSTGLRRRDVGRWRLHATVAVSDLPAELAPLVAPRLVDEVRRELLRLQDSESATPSRIVLRGQEVLAAFSAAQQSPPRVGDGFELRSTPDGALWFTEVAADARWPPR